MPTPLQTGRVAVEVVAIANGQGFAKNMLVPVGQTVGWAVNASGLYGLAPHLKGAKLGIWGKVVAPEVQVRLGDRVEVYTPVNPAATERHRARKRLPKGASLP